MWLGFEALVAGFMFSLWVALILTWVVIILLQWIDPPDDKKDITLVQVLKDQAHRWAQLAKRIW